jgi:hypothetical protein
MAKRKAKSRASKRRSPPTFFQKLGKLFKSIFSAPSIDKAEKKRAQAEKAIKARKYSPSYEKRLLRGLTSGKAPSLQAARGHKPGEARTRAQREREAQGGLTSRESAQVAKFYGEWNPAGNKIGKPSNRNTAFPTSNQFLMYAQKYGYKRFAEYRDAYREIRKQYLKALRNGTNADRGADAFMSLADFMGEFADMGFDDPDIWFFYA